MENREVVDYYKANDKLNSDYDKKVEKLRQLALDYDPNKTDTYLKVLLLEEAFKFSSIYRDQDFSKLSFANHIVFEEKYRGACYSKSASLHRLATNPDLL